MPRTKKSLCQTYINNNRCLLQKIFHTLDYYTNYILHFRTIYFITAFNLIIDIGLFSNELGYQTKNNKWQYLSSPFIIFYNLLLISYFPVMSFTFVKPIKEMCQLYIMYLRNFCFVHSLP